ncbi:MAG: response regulator [Chitinophagaceae bacterium]
MEKHILLIDDDKTEWKIFNDALKNLADPFTYTHVHTSEEAVRLSKELNPDFVFIDLNLESGKGVECLQQLKKIKKLKDTLFITYSDTIDQDMISKAKSMGAIFIKKPYFTTTMTQHLKTIMVSK